MTWLFIESRQEEVGHDVNQTFTYLHWFSHSHDVFMDILYCLFKTLWSFFCCCEMFHGNRHWAGIMYLIVILTRHKLYFLHFITIWMKSNRIKTWHILSLNFVKKMLTPSEADPKRNHNYQNNKYGFLLNHIVTINNGPSSNKTIFVY